MGSVRIFLMGVCGGNSLCCVLFLFDVFDNMPPPISGLIRLLRTPFGRALTSSLIEPLVLRLPASERWRAVRRGWVRVLCPRRLLIFFGMIRLPRLPASERW